MFAPLLEKREQAGRALLLRLQAGFDLYDNITQTEHSSGVDSSVIQPARPVPLMPRGHDWAHVSTMAATLRTPVAALLEPVEQVVSDLGKEMSDKSEPVPMRMSAMFLMVFVIFVFLLAGSGLLADKTKAAWQKRNAPA